MNGVVGLLTSGSAIALFTDNILHLHYNEIERESEAISGKNDKIARNCLVSTLNCIAMQMSKVICEKGYCSGFYVYEVKNPLVCRLRYCGNKKFKVSIMWNDL